MSPKDLVKSGSVPLEVEVVAPYASLNSTTQDYKVEVPISSKPCERKKVRSYETKEKFVVAYTAIPRRRVGPHASPDSRRSIFANAVQSWVDTYACNNADQLLEAKQNEYLFMQNGAGVYVVVNPLTEMQLTESHLWMVETVDIFKPESLEGKLFARELKMSLQEHAKNFRPEPPRGPFDDDNLYRAAAA